jgi:virginiamycin A acetyltransferase
MTGPDPLAIHPVLGHPRGDTVVGSDVWIGARATVLPGVTIGNGAIIGTEAVVGSDVPDYAVVVGNPAKVIKLRFNETDVADLLDIAWWNWPVQTITDNLAAIRGADVAALRQAQRDMT